MTGRKNSAVGSGIAWLLLPLLGVDAYAGWQLWRVADHWAVKLFSSFSDSLTQLAVILIVNSLAILILALVKS